MIPTRRSQPYRKGMDRQQGLTLQAMLRGRPAFTPNPIDLQRYLQKRSGIRLY